MEIKLLGVNLKDRMWNKELRRRNGIEDAAKAARRLKWRWGGHVTRMDQERWAYAMTVWDPRIGRRNRGSPRRREDKEFREIVGNQWSRVAGDKREVERHILRYIY
jgi:hypothetical protein